MSEASEAGEQLLLLRARTRIRTPRPVAEVAAELPVARVLVDLPLAHLDRPFDYAVPASMAATARPGVRVRVRFAGQDVDGFVAERVAASDHLGRLTPLRRVVSAERVLDPAVLRLARAVADRYAGTLADVLRLAVPPRHAGTERAVLPDPADLGPVPVADDVWAPYPQAPAFLARVRAGEAPRAVWTALPGQHWAAAVAAAAASALDGGRGVLAVVPDRRDLDVLEPAVVGLLGPDRHARLEADLGPAARYAAYLALLRGRVRLAIGTRAAAFAPVQDLGLAVIWDDGDDQHSEPRAPYPHAREVLALRAEESTAAMLVGGWSVTAEGAALLRAGWARPIAAPRALLRRRWPRVRVADDTGPGDQDAASRAARVPPAAWRAVRAGLAQGSVLVQVPRAGYLPGTACRTCRRSARCPQCHGPIRVDRGGPQPAPAQRVGCGWCGLAWPVWTCPHCGGQALRARSVGVERTAEELGRAFPGARVMVSRAERLLPRVPDHGGLVLATAGVEPVAPGGYAAAVLLDGDALLERPDLRAAEEALRRWLAAAALVRSADEGGVVVVCADPAAPAVQALVRVDPLGLAERELAERAALGLPPAAAVASLVGPPQAVAGLLAAAELPARVVVLGPVALDEGAEPVVRTVLQVPRADRAALAQALRAALAVRSARRDPGAVRVRVDARELG